MKYELHVQFKCVHVCALCKCNSRAVQSILCKKQCSPTTTMTTIVMLNASFIETNELN